jgi:ABC-type multidrug transport system fused ATPase/permease subunit
MQRNQESFSSVLIDFLSGIHTIKIFAMEKFSLKKYKEQNDRMAELQSKNAKYSLLTRPVLHTITTFCLAFVVIVGLYTLKMSIAQLVVFCGLLHLFYEPVKKFAEENANIQRGVVAAERMFEVLELKTDIKDNDGAIEFSEFKDKIEFVNVSFRYKEKWILKDLSFTIKKGERVAIIGPTGAGKSTIVQLLPRLYDIQSGEILIDGIPLKKYTQKSLRQKIGFVPQKPFLFYDTVYENIAFGMSYSKEEIEEAARKSYADEFINSLPDTYNTLLEETGKTLSGGQQQRLAIARALVKKAPILVLDEATSALDAISENKIKLALEGLTDTTQILIAHRLSTIEHADKIIYLDKGKKIAEGTKDELMISSSHFKAMWDSFHKTKAATPK